MMSPAFTLSSIFTSGLWLMQVVLIRALELAQIVDVDAGIVRVESRR
jgi:hypothetical protein